jgi:hypothetical protein
MKAILISLIVIAVVLGLVGVIKMICVSAYQYASGIVEDYYDALDYADDDKEYQDEMIAKYDELMKSNKPFIALARCLYF